MEQAYAKQTVLLSRPVMDAREEYVLSGDYVLPDYCPDVAVVLKCSITPTITGRQWNGDLLMLEGTALVQVLYLDEERMAVRQVEFTQPVACSLRGEGASAAMVELTLSPEYANCRATGPRRLEVHGSFTVHALAIQACEQELLSPAPGEGLYVQTCPVQLAAPKAWAERMAAISEVPEFPEGMPEAEQLLGCRCCASVQECKLLAGKAIVKGQLYVHCLYTDDTAAGTSQVLEYTLPFSQILDVEGAMEGDAATATAMLLSDTQRLAQGNSGQNTALEIAAKLLIQVQIYGSCAAALVTDAYHGRCPVVLQHQTVNCRSLLGAQRQTVTVAKSPELPGKDLQEILDVWVQPVALSTACEAGMAHPAGKLLVSMLVRQADGTVAYYERPEDFCLDIPAECDAAQATFAVMGVQYTVTNSRLELQIRLAMTLYRWAWQTVEAVSDITLQEDKSYPPEEAAVKLYFAQPGERVWEIARECHASPEALREENSLPDEVLKQRTVLVIPMC